MADGIKGTKSHLYIQAPVIGVENSEDNMKHVSVQEIPGFRAAVDVVIHGAFSLGTKTVSAVSDMRKLTIVAHGAEQGDIVRPSDGVFIHEEFSIIKVIDADTVILSVPVGSAINGATVEILKHVTPRYDENGNLFVNATPGPTQFILDGVEVEVEEDSTDVTNNIAFPSKIFIQKDGETRPVNKDTGVAANTVAVPVEIVGVSGQVINITAGDINVQTTSEGASFDSMRIGSGVGLYADITANNELATHDQDALAVLDSLDVKTPNLESGRVPVVTGLLQGLTDSQLRATPVPVSGPVTDAELRATALPVSGPLTDSQLRATAVPVSGVLTDAELRATPVPVSGTVTANSAVLAATFQEITNLTTTAQTFIAPANARWCKISTDNTNTENIRVKIGGVATTTSGISMEPSRTEDFSAVGNISVISEAGTNQKICVIFGA
jgi:hypothetical protein